MAESLEQAVRGPDGQQRLLASFIHSVVPPLATISHLQSARSNKAAWLAGWRDRGIYLHKTHVGMAVQVGPACMRPSTTHPWSCHGLSAGIA